MGRVISFEMSSQNPELAVAFYSKYLAGRLLIQTGNTGQSRRE